MGTVIGELLIGIASGDDISIVTGTGGALGPCNWPLDFSCCDLPTGSEAVTGAMSTAAVELDWALSGRQFGECLITFRPCKRQCGSFPDWWSTTMPWPFPVFRDGEWLNLTCGSCPGECSCGPVEEVILPGPVTRIVEVRIDGVALDPSAYRLDNRRTLVRQDGGTLPSCNDFSKAAGEEGTWTVKAMYGSEVPKLGQLSAAEITCELVKACVAPASCRLPANWQTLARQGVTIQRQQVSAFMRTQSAVALLPMTAEFLRAYNPNLLNSPSRVYSPDIPEPRRTF